MKKVDPLKLLGILLVIMTGLLEAAIAIVGQEIKKAKKNSAN